MTPGKFFQHVSLCSVPTANSHLSAETEKEEDGMGKGKWRRREKGESKR